MKVSRYLVAATRSRQFTLIELLVVVAIIAVLSSLLLPGLAMAREKSKRATCAANLRQLVLAADMYADDAGEYYPIHGYAGYVPHLMEDRAEFARDYLGGSHRIFFCPSSAGLWRPPCLSWGQMTEGKAPRKEYMGYGYFGGPGSSDPTYLNDPLDYYGWHWAKRTIWDGKVGSPTVKRTIPRAWGTGAGAPPPDHEPADRPLFSDNAFAYYSLPYLLNLSQGRSAPVNNHVDGDLLLPAFENIAYVDGHVQPIHSPSKLPVKGPWGIRF